MTKPLISIIVPVYRAEKYLAKCVESLLSQTYKNIEIILVDDGSPDKSGEICDQFREKDRRVKVIHQDNGGQSKARNMALSVAKGEYIGFVDSDDWIDSDMYSVLFDNLQLSQSDISCCQFRRVDEDGNTADTVLEKKVNSYDNLSAMKVLIEDREIGSHPCTKLFKCGLFKDVQFPIGRVYEDIAIMHIIFSKAKRVVVTSERKYNYLINANSTSYTQTPKWGYSLFCAFGDRYEFISENYPSLVDFTRERYLGIAVGMFIHWQKFGSFDGKAKMENEVRRVLHNERKYLLKYTSISTSRKIDALLIVFVPLIVKCKYKIFYCFRKTK